MRRGYKKANLFQSRETQSCQSHFSASLTLDYPLHLLRFSYKELPEDHSLILDRHHNVGNTVDTIDISKFETSKESLVELSRFETVQHIVLEGSKIAPFTLETLQELFKKSLRSLNLCNCRGVSASSLLTCLAIFEKLESLNLSNWINLTDESFRLMKPIMKNLVALNISRCPKLTDDSLIFLATNGDGKKFQSLWASRNDNFTFRGINTVLWKFEKIQLLDISYCSQISFVGLVVKTDISLQYVTRDLKIMSIKSKQPSLSEVEDKKKNKIQANTSTLGKRGSSVTSKKSQIKTSPGVVNLQPESIDWLGSAGGTLSHIEFSGLQSMTDGCLGALIQGAGGQLIRLAVNRCNLISNGSLLNLTRYPCRQSLQDLDIGRIDASLKDETIQQILTICSNIRFLCISGNPSLTDAMFCGLKKSTILQIRKLDISYLSLTAVGIVEISKRCPNLRYLDISSDKNITDEGLIALGASCPNLITFVARNCPRLTDRGVITMISNLSYPHSNCQLQCIILSSDIRYIDPWLHRLIQFTDDALLAIVKGCPYLRILELCNQAGIGFLHPEFQGENIKLRGWLPYLEKLDIRGVDGELFSMIGCKNLIRICCSLNHLVVPFHTEESKEMFSGSSFCLNEWIDRRVYCESSTHQGSSMKKSFFKKNAMAFPHSMSSPTASFASIPSSRDPLSMASNGIKDRLLQRPLIRQYYSFSLKSQDVTFPLDPTPGTALCKLAAPIMESSSSSSSSGSVIFPGVNLENSVIDEEDTGWNPLEPSELQDGSNLDEKSVQEGLSKASIQSPQKMRVMDEGSMGFELLRPYAWSSLLRYRDALLRRVWLEEIFVRKIQLAFRKYSLWKRVKYRVSARRIANTYKVILERRKFQLILNDFIRNRVARLIQRKFRTSVGRFAFAAIRIQRWHRRHLFAMRCSLWPLKQEAAICIQKRVRGMLVRLSEGFLLSQVYRRLPPFWKEFLGARSALDWENYKPNLIREGVSPERRRADRSRVFIDQIEDLQSSASGMIQSIRVAQENPTSSFSQHQQYDIHKGKGKPRLAPKLPMVIPQPFDKNPYVSLTDGSVMTFYSEKGSILSIEDSIGNPSEAGALIQAQKSGTGVSNAAAAALLQATSANAAPLSSKTPIHAPIHIFNIQLWPLTKPIPYQDPSTLLHDSHVNAFDVVQNSREPLICETCHHRLRGITCQACQRGYCFYCAFRLHTKPTHRNHRLQVMEPQIVRQHEVSTSLVFHVDMAKKIHHDLTYLVKYLRSAAEVKRIQEEKRLKKEHEDEQERKRLEFIKASQEEHRKHEAVTVLALWFRVQKATRLVEERRKQKHLEAIISGMKKERTVLIPAQRIFREYSTRKWLADHGVKFKLVGPGPWDDAASPTKKSKKRGGAGGGGGGGNTAWRKLKVSRVKMTPEDLEARVDYEVFQRRLIERTNLIDHLLRDYVTAMQTIEANIDYWTQYLDKLPSMTAEMTILRDYYQDVYESHVRETATKKADLLEREYQELERESRRLSIRVEFMTRRLENTTNAVWWIKQILRNNFRRREAVKERFKDFLHRNYWLVVESTMISRIEYHLFGRKKGLNGKKSVKLSLSWLDRQALYCALHQSTLDMTQQSLLVEESERLSRDNANTMELDNLLEELVSALHQDSRYYGERVALDMAATVPSYAKTISSVPLDITSKLVTLKRKQTQLQESVLDTVKVGLQKKLNDEDAMSMNFYAFLNDNVEISIEEMKNIRVLLIDKFAPSRSYFQIYFSGEESKKKNGEVDHPESPIVAQTKDLMMKSLAAVTQGVTGLLGGLKKKLAQAMKTKEQEEEELRAKKAKEIEDMKAKRGKSKKKEENDDGNANNANNAGNATATANNDGKKKKKKSRRQREEEELAAMEREKEEKAKREAALSYRVSNFFSSAAKNLSTMLRFKVLEDDKRNQNKKKGKEGEDLAADSPRKKDRKKKKDTETSSPLSSPKHDLRKSSNGSSLGDKKGILAANAGVTSSGEGVLTTTTNDSGLAETSPVQDPKMMAKLEKLKKKESIRGGAMLAEGVVGSMSIRAMDVKENGNKDAMAVIDGDNKNPVADSNAIDSSKPAANGLIEPNGSTIASVNDTLVGNQGSSDSPQAVSTVEASSSQSATLAVPPSSGNTDTAVVETLTDPSKTNSEAVGMKGMKLEVRTDELTPSQIAFQARQAYLTEISERGPHHISPVDFLEILHLQPWLGEEALQDVKLEEGLQSLELALEKVQFEIETLHHQRQDAEEKKTAAEAQLKEIHTEIEIRNDPYYRQREEGKKVFEEESPEEEQERLASIDVLRAEVIKKDAEVALQSQMITRLQEMEGPKSTERDDLIQRISSEREKIEKRAQERSRLMKVFFDAEKEICATLFEEVAKEIHDLEGQISQIKKHISTCEVYSTSPEMTEKILTGELDLGIRTSLKINLNTYDFKYMHAMHETKPRTFPVLSKYVQIRLEAQNMLWQIEEVFLNALKKCLEEEEAALTSFEKERERLEKGFFDYQDYLLHIRRQRSVQQEISQRYVKLHQLRDIRLLTLKEEKQKSLELKKQQEEMKEQKKVARNEAMKRFASDTKQGIRQAKDFVRRLRHNLDVNMDPEEQRIAKNLRLKAKEGSSKQVEGVRRLFFTVGEDEATKFQQQNDLLLEKGLPYFVRMARSMGGNSLTLWMQKTFDVSQFITHIQLAHKNPSAPTYADLTKQGFEAVSHRSSNLVLWVRQDVQRTRGMNDLALSFTEQEEVRCQIEGYEKLEPSLSAFDLADISLWWRKIEKMSSAVASNTNALVQEVMKVRGMLKAQPKDRNLIDLHNRMQDRLKKAHEKEQSYEVTNPLQTAVDLMALTPKELEQWMQIFEKIDKDRDSRISMDELFEFLDLGQNPYYHSIFRIVDAFDRDGNLEFGDFVRTVSSFGFFGKDEVLRSLFVFADEDRVGYITHQQFVKLLNILHPFDKARAKRALIDMKMEESRHMLYEEFRKVNDSYPALFHPAFHYQNRLREKCLGVDWWFDKLRKYENVRRKLTKSSENTDKLAQLEMERFEMDQIKAQRMEERSRDIRQESSQIRKTLLQAKQFLDEFS